MIRQNSSLDCRRCASYRCQHVPGCSHRSSHRTRSHRRRRRTERLPPASGDPRRARPAHRADVPGLRRRRDHRSAWPASASCSSAGRRSCRSRRCSAGVYLIAFGVHAAMRAWRPAKLEAGDGAAMTTGRAVLLTLALTWLNPHFYLDAVLMLGTVANSFGDRPLVVPGRHPRRQRALVLRPRLRRPPAARPVRPAHRLARARLRASPSSWARLGVGLLAALSRGRALLAGEAGPCSAIASRSRVMAIGPTPWIAASSAAEYAVTCSSVVTPTSRRARVAGAPMLRGSGVPVARGARSRGAGSPASTTASPRGDSR